MVGDYLFHIGSFGIPSMGFCILIGTILALITCYFARKFTNLDWNDEILDGVIWAVLAGFIGMKILYWIVTPEDLISVIQNPSWKGVWTLITSGMVFYGGLFGGIVGLLLLCLRRKRNFFTFSDLILPCFCIAHSGGRIGCLLVGCCYGVAEGEACLNNHFTYDGFLSVTYRNGIHRLPVPLMEAVFLLILAAVLLLVLKNNKHRGTVTAWYLILYSVWRFCIEFFRGDAIRGIYGPLATSQWISIVTLAAGIIVFVLSRKWPKDEPLKEFHEDDLTVPEEVIPEQVPVTEEPEESDSKSAGPQEFAEEAEVPADTSEVSEAAEVAAVAEVSSGDDASGGDQ